MPDVVIEETGADLYDAIDRATDRAERSVERRLTYYRERIRAAGLFNRVSVNN
jgi:ribosome-associated translation inhibitor RaiA